MTPQLTHLRYVTRLAYGDSPRISEHDQTGKVKVYGSNGPYALHHEANTKAPAIIIGRKGSYGKINWSSDPCFASDTTFFVDSTTTDNHLRWIYYALQTLELDTGSNEAAVPGLNRDEAYSKQVLVPPIHKQKAIAEYLDQETAVIDKLITAMEKLLTLLAEKRQATITQAVTRGLDPSAPLRHTGIPWLPQIPTHWAVRSIKHLGRVGNGSTPLRGKMAYWKNGAFPWLTSTVVNDDIVQEASQFVTEKALIECHLPIVAPNSVLVAITGQGKTRGKAALLPFQATINQHMAFITPDTSQLLAEFLQLYLSSMYQVLRMISEGTGSTRGALTIEQIAEFPITLPSLSEQKAIVTNVKSVNQKLDGLSKAISKTIDLLQERRVSLISAAVTGQIHITA